jgi:NADH:ubiquinone oxidoreductase subunit C
MFAYELPVSGSLQGESQQPAHSLSNTTVVYNFHNIRNHDRFFIFSPAPSSPFLAFPLHSVSELYPNSNWLEREVSELHGIVFNGKKDLRNLMLQYGDTSTPFQKAYPSVGLKEVFYDSNTDLIVQLPVSLQV